MKKPTNRTICYCGLLVLIWCLGSIHAQGGACAVSDGSLLPSDDGCALAFVYNQKDDHRLVVLNEKKRHRYEAPLRGPKRAPFWEKGKVYVLDTSGTVQGFSVVSERLVAEKEEPLVEGLVRVAEYVRSQHRLYVIRVWFDDQRRILHELLAIDFPARKTLWTKRIDDAGLLQIRDSNVSVTGVKLVQVFNCDTGEKIGVIETPHTTTQGERNSPE